MPKIGSRPAALACALTAVIGAAACGAEDVELSSVPAGDGRAGATGSTPEDADQPSPGATADKGCRKVDLLFVVDNSLSMQQKQDNLSRSFPGFIDVVERTLGTRDYRVMAVDTDASGGLGGLLSLTTALQGEAECRPAPACCRQACRLRSLPLGFDPVDTCNALGCDEILATPADRCEGTLGAGKRLSPEGRDCGLIGGARYMGNAQPGLSEAFSCAARVGSWGDGDEEPMGSMMAALSPALNAEGSCNEGFLRDDAILVVTFITDEDDEDSPGNPEVWRQALLEAKGGNEQAVVVLGLIGDGDVEGGLPGGPCDRGQADPAPALREFAQSLAFGSLGSVCAPDYAPFFAQAVAMIDTACDEFTPPLIR